MTESAEKNVVFALDDPREARRMLRRLAGSPKWKGRVCAVKVGLPVIIKEGIGFIKHVKRWTKLDVYCDLKLAEVPFITARVCEIAADAGADGVIVQGFVGSQAISAIREARSDLKIILVSEMTHNAGGFTSEIADKVAVMAKTEGVYGIIAPATRPERIKTIDQLVGDRVEVFATGIGAQKGTELEALHNGADRIILGRQVSRELGGMRLSAKAVAAQVIWYLVGGAALGAALVFLGRSKLQVFAEDLWLSIFLFLGTTLITAIGGWFRGRGRI